MKYDWRSASRLWKDEDMRALQKTGRPIMHSLCQYGRAGVGEWGPIVGGNSWRTTFDIRDQWASMEQIGFAQHEWAKFSGPGHWNDPDMLEIGNGGMKTEEYRTHMSLWAIVPSILMAGNDLRTMSAETRELLMNREVIAVNQDKLGKGGIRVKDEVWMKPLADGSTAVCLFNRGEEEKTVGVTWAELSLKGGKKKVRDLWKHADLGMLADGYSATVPAHGVVMVRVGR